MARPFIVLTGMHASGKSSAGTYLSSLGYLSHAEMGWALRQHHLRTHPEAMTLKGEGLTWFDQSILQAELQRDSFLDAFNLLPHCVETWHLGNLAYASSRSPTTVPE